MKGLLVTRVQIARECGVHPDTLKRYLQVYFDQIPFYFTKRRNLTKKEADKVKEVLKNELGFEL